MRLWHFSSHLQYVKAAIGISDGNAIALLLLLTSLQLAAAITLYTVRINKTISTITMSGALILEFLMYDVRRDTQLMCRTAVIMLELIGSLLDERDRDARSRCFHLPLSSSALAAQYCVRTACTHLHARTWMPPLCALVVSVTTLTHPYWLHRGALFEMGRVTFMCRLSLCSLMLHLSGHDASPSFWPNVVEVLASVRVRIRTHKRKSKLY